MISSTLSAVLQTKGLPPKVEPCVPRVKSVAALPFAKQAPIGTPLPKINAALSKRLLINIPGGFRRFLPPLIINQTEADIIIDTVCDLIGEL
jgi:acetylornithine/succinyldiaminopimelate/putrescine aminotransferase